MFQYSKELLFFFLSFFSKISFLKTSTSQIWKKQFKGHFEGSVRAYVEGASVGRAFVASLGMSSHCCGKNSPWCTGWESQQQRRKLRPASQISSLSAAVLIRPDALVGPMFSITWRLYARSPFGSQSQCTTQGRPCPNKAAQIPRS